MKNIIITGCPKTGTTALCLLLSSSPKVLVTNEMGFFHAERKVFNEKIKNELCRENKIILNSKKIDHKLFCELIDKKKLQSDNIVYVGDKRPDYCLNYNIAKHIVKNYPEAYFIFTYREPCATACSFLEMTKTYPNSQHLWYAKDVEKACDTIIKLTNNWITMLYSKVKNKIVIDYEKFINQPQALVDKLETFLETKLEINNPEKVYFNSSYRKFESILSDNQKAVINTRLSLIKEKINQIT